MTKRNDRLSLSLGADHEQRRGALEALAADVQAIGRNKVPSISALVSALADAYSDRPELVADGLAALLQAARDPAERDADGNLIRVRLWPDAERDGGWVYGDPADYDPRQVAAIRPPYGVDYTDEEER